MKAIYFNRFCRALVLLLALLGFSAKADLSSIFTNAAPKAIPRRASIIFIQVDGLGYGDLSCYGQTKFQTPNLDKLATGGIRFTNYSVADAVSSSHAALLLGKNPAHLRQRADADIPLAPDEITVAQILKNSGYHTGLIGGWMLGDKNSGGSPWKKGFDEFAGYLDPDDAANFYADYIWRFDPHYSYDEISGKWIEWRPSQGPPNAGTEMLYPNTAGKKGEYIPDVLTKAALNFIKENQPDQFNHYQPFFLLLNYEIPDDRIVVPTDAPFSEESWPQPEKNKAALILSLDGYIGQLREQLEKAGMTNNVVIFFSSGSIPTKTAEIDPDFFHSNISTNDFRVPMIVNWPGRIPAGQVSALNWSAQDFLPTAAEIAFTKPPENIDGTSILPVLLGQAQK
ncbi:MAG TPA: sulfatase-like hydrolase/transferase [Candidatus Baltobacteraceae bacterium]|nr:sulfatase-like hydrolase/transferase [Candidatus Baltobacteraceae bacterium]